MDDSVCAPAWPRSIIHPAEYAGGEIVSISWDLGKVPDKEVRAVCQAWCEALPTMPQVRALQLWTRVPQAVFDAACAMPNLEYLSVKWSSLTTLDAIGALRGLRWFVLGSSTRLASLEPLRALPKLHTLELENVKLIHDFTPLQALTSLRRLAVTGSMWTRQKLGSLEPFARMTWLEALALDTAAVESIRPLARLTGLKELVLGGRLPVEEYAWLAARLPGTQCRWFAPCYELSAMNAGRCQRCHNDTLVLLTGGSARALCRVCDAARVARHEAVFADAKARAQA
jgi:Leucine-rich repeat (LRR) protein